MLSDKATCKRTAQILKTLGNVHRLQIVSLLLGGEKNVSDINKSVKISQPSLSQHLSKLRREGVLDARRDQRQIYYSISNLQVPRVLHVASEMVQGQANEKKAKSA